MKKSLSQRGYSLCSLVIGSLKGLFLLYFCFLSACGVIKERPESKPSDLAVLQKPLPPEKAKEVLNEVGGNFAYGPGLGDAAVNVGAVVAFPPYAIYLLGNAVLSFSGYEPVTVSSLLPEETGKAWSDSYDTVVSGPGRFVAAAAGHEYRTSDVGMARLQKVLAEGDSEGARAQMKKQEQGR